VLRSTGEQKQNEDSFLVVFEDDARAAPGKEDVLRRTEDLVRTCDEVSSSLGEHWDVLLLGCLPVKYETFFTDRRSDRILRIRRFYGTHAMVVPGKRAARVCELLSGERGIEQQIDSAMSDLAESGRLRVFSPSESLVKQEGEDTADLTNPTGSSIQLPLIPEEGVDPASPLMRGSRR
jgi:hypothetical protein